MMVMKERPILFSGEMVRAILAEQKTQTRRVMKPQPVNLVDAIQWKKCPHGIPGDRLWVRETWAAPGYLDHRKPSDIEDWNPILYRADGFIARQFEVGWSWLAFMFGRWRPSIFMPRWASRIMLEIVNVRVERVREITEEDAREEGIIIPDYMAGTVRLPHGGAPVLRTSYGSRFADLWDRINAKPGYGWDTNPWVWVIEFRVMEG